MTPRMWTRPSASGSARLAQKRAVSSKISAPASQQERVVAGRLPVLPDRVGDVGADVVLLLAAEHLDDAAPLGSTIRSGVVSSPVSADSHA